MGSSNIPGAARECFLGVSLRGSSDRESKLEAFGPRVVSSVAIKHLERNENSNKQM